MKRNKIEKEAIRKHISTDLKVSNGADDKNVKTTWPALQMDVEYFQGFLDDQELSESEKSELIATLWNIMVTFVDLGFGIEPTQRAISEKHLENARKLIANKRVPPDRQLTKNFNDEKQPRNAEGADA